MAEAVQESYEIDLTDSKTLLISDFEGTTPTAHFAKFKEYCTGIDNKGVVSPTNRVVFLGDVFDNTAQFGTKCKGEECKDPDDDEDNCVDNSNYVALETIKLLVDNEERCNFVVGNRDINKIKLIPFFSFQTGEKWWTNGNSYEEIVNNLMTKLKDDEDPWLIKKEQLKYFRPFWSTKPEEYNKGWLDDKDIKFIDIYDRFERIFGKDPAPGTMSALVTLKCIPNELFPEMTNFYGAMSIKAEKPQNDEEDLKLHVEWRKKVRAALTITIFMRMLDKDLWGKRGEIDKKEFKALDGYLYYYLTKAPAAYYAEYQNNLFLFAHGGITNDFVKGDGKFEIDEKKGRDLKDWITIIKERKIETKIEKKIGGGVNQKNKIIKSINNYNNEFMGVLNQFFDTKFDDPNGKWILPMLTLLDLSAGVKKNPNQVKEPYGENLDKYKDTYEKIYNVFGHASISSGYTFGKTRNKKGEVIGKDTYFLSTDYSTTLFKNGIVCDKKTKGPDSDYNKNYLLAILDGTSDSSLKLNIIGKLVLKNVTEKNTNEKKKNYVFRYGPEKNIADFDELIRQTETETLFLPDTVEKTDKVELNFDTNLLDKIDNIDKVNTSTNCLFNGIATLKEKEYYVYSNIFNKDKKPYSIILLPFEGGAQVNPGEANTASVSNATTEASIAAPGSANATSEATPGSSTSAPGSATSAPGSATSAPGSATSAPGSATSAPGSSTPAPTTGSAPAPGSAAPAPSTPGSATPAKKTATKKPISGLRDPVQMFEPILLVKNTKTGYYEQEAGKHNLLKKGWTKTTFSKKVGPKTRKTLKKVGPKTRKTWKKVGPKTRKLNGRKLKRRKVRSKKRKTLKKN